MSVSWHVCSCKGQGSVFRICGKSAHKAAILRVVPFLRLDVQDKEKRIILEGLADILFAYISVWVIMISQYDMNLVIAFQSRGCSL